MQMYIHGTVLVAVSAVVVIACWPIPERCEAHLNCPSPDSTVGAANAEPKPSCDAALDDAKGGCGVDEKYAVFVAPNGNDETGDGSRARPFASLNKAAETAKAS